VAAKIKQSKREKAGGKRAKGGIQRKKERGRELERWLHFFSAVQQTLKRTWVNKLCKTHGEIIR